MATVEEVIKDVEQGVTVAAQAAALAAPIVAVFNPGVGAAMQLLSPIAASFVVKGGELVIQFRKDLTSDQLVQLLEASKSANWPTPPPITAG